MCIGGARPKVRDSRQERSTIRVRKYFPRPTSIVGFVGWLEFGEEFDRWSIGMRANVALGSREAKRIECKISVFIIVVRWDGCPNGCPSPSFARAEHMHLMQMECRLVQFICSRLLRTQRSAMGTFQPFLSQLNQRIIRAKLFAIWKYPLRFFFSLPCDYVRPDIPVASAIETTNRYDKTISNLN